MDHRAHSNNTGVKKDQASELEIEREQVRHVHALAPFGIVATVLNATVVFFILRNELPPRILESWLASIILLSFVRLLLVLRFRKIPVGDLNIRNWRAVFTVGLALSGTLWGALGLIPFSDISVVNEVFIAFVLGGMSAGAAASFSALKEGYLAYAVPALTPLTIHFFLTADDGRHLAMAGMLLLYSVFLWRISWHHYRANRTSLQLRFENRGMIRNLKRAKDELERMYASVVKEIDAKLKAEAELRLHQEHLERVVEERTADLRRVNEQLRARIEERMQAEDRRARAEQDVRRSEALYRTIARNMPDTAVTLVDRQYRFLLAEGSLLEKMGLKQEKVEGHTLEEAFDKQTSARIEEGFRRALSGESASFEQEFDGHVVWSRYVPVQDDQGKVLTAINLSVDITDRKHAEQERERLIAELERSNRELQQFAYVASHDLQEPLRTVASYVELLARRYQGRLDPAADKYISYAVQGANRMSSLINDLLAYSRVSTRGRPFRPVDMNEVLKMVLADLESAIEESNALVTGHSLPTVKGDQSQLIQLLQNLIGNAIKFRRNDVRPVITVSGENKEGEWIFGVHDNGIGIDTRFHERIFQIFQRLHTREEFPGTGVGLAICKRIVERHRGRIWVASSTEGTSFYFTIPA